MKPLDGEAAGQRIARARRRRGLSQAVLAGLVGRSESWLSQVERGKRGIDSHSVLTRLAEVLRVDVAEIIGSEPGGGDTQGAYPAAPLIEQAMLGYGSPGESAPERPGRHRQVSHLHARARSAYQAYQATRYDATGRLLPGLIRDIEAAGHITGPGTPAVCKVRALVYDTAAALLNRVGEPFLAWAAADRAMSAAAYSGEPLLAAVGAWRLSYIVTSRKHPQEALDLAMSAAGALGRCDAVTLPGAAQRLRCTPPGRRHRSGSRPGPGDDDGAAGDGARYRRPHWGRQPPGNRLRSCQRLDPRHLRITEAR